MKPEGSAAARRGALTAAVLVVPAVLGYAIFFYRDLLDSRVYVFRDIYTILLATEHVVRLLSEWEWPPLWNPLQVLGKPLVAEPLGGVYYPLNWAFRLLPEPLGFNVSIAWHHLWTAAGVYLLVRRRSGSVAAAALAGLLASFGGLYVSFDNMINALQAAAWVPWAVLAFDVWCDRRDAAGIALLALALAMTLLGGMPEAYLLENALILALIVERRRSGSAPALASVAATCLVANLLALGIGAVHLLPFAEYLANSTRAAGLSSGTVMGFSLRPLGALAFFVPRRYHDATGRFHATAALWEGDLSRAPWALSLYVGPLLLLALGSGARLSRFQQWWWGSFAAVFAALALGGHLPGLGSIVAETPLLRFARYPEKILIVPHLLLAIAAGLGLDGLIESGARARRLTLVAAAAAIAALAAALAVQRWETFRAAVLSADLFALAVLLIVLGTLAATSRRAPRAIALGLLVLAAADLYRVNARFLPTVAWSDVMRVPRAASVMKRGEDPLRIYSDGVGLPAVPEHPHAFLQEQNLLLMEVANYYGIANLNAPASLNLADHQRLEQLIESAPRERVAALLGAFNTAYVTSPKRLERPGLIPLVEARGPTEAFVYQVENVKPRAFAPRRLHVAADPGAAIDYLRRLADFEGEVVIAEGDIRAGLPERMAGDVRIESYLGGRVDLRASMQTAGLVVLTDTFYPGWYADIDDNPAPIVRANYFARGVFVEPGEHRITFRYDPASHRVGLYCSVACVLIVLACIAVSALRRR